jgi:hypothetical protein
MIILRRRRGCAPSNTLAALQSETVALLRQMQSRPNKDRLVLIDGTIDDLKDAGIWAKYGALWVMAAHDSQAACLNWISPTTIPLVNYNNTTFAADVGYTGNATNMYLSPDAGWNSISHYKQNDASMFAWITGGTDAADTRFVIGQTGGTANSRLIPRNSTGQYSANINSGTSTAGGTSSTIIGLTHANRSGASAVQVYRNGSSVLTGTQASTAPTSQEIEILKSGSVYAAFEVAIAGIGSSLDATQASDLHTILGNYLSGL